jgi:hypothetical protein
MHFRALGFSAGAVRDVSRVFDQQSFVHQKFQYRCAGPAITARVDLLHNIHYRLSSSQIRIGLGEVNRAAFK